MNNSFLSSSLFRVFTAFFSVFVLVLSLCSFSFAYTDTSTNGIDFALQPLPKVSSSATTAEKYDSGLKVSVNPDNNYVASWYTAQSYDIYVFAIPENDAFRTYACSVGLPSDALCFLAMTGTIPGSGSYSSVYTLSLTNAGYDSVRDIRYNSSIFSDITPSKTINIPIFSSANAGFDAILDWIENPPSDDSFGTPSEIRYTLPAGNVAFINVSGLYGTCNLRISGTALSWNPTAIQYVGSLNSIPTSFSIPISGTNIINWQGSGKSDFLGRYSNWSYFYGAYAGNSNYICVANPLSQLATNNADGTISNNGGNPGIEIFVSNANGIRVFNLKETFSFGVPVSEQEGDTFTGHVDEDGTLYFTNDETGDVESPVHGGNNAVNNTFTNINDWLQNIATQIGNFFRGAIGAVSTLVGAGSDFIHSLTSLYSWLPAPVYAVLSSALILVITIGVIKVFI